MLVCRQGSDGGAVGCQGGLARCCEEVSAWRGAAEWAKTRGPACRLGRGSCNTCALGASSARTEGVRRNAVACYRSQVRLASNRTRLEIEGNSRDKVVWSGGQVHNVYLRSCQISPCAPGVCQNAKAPRLFLEGPNLPDQYLLGCTRGW